MSPGSCPSMDYGFELPPGGGNVDTIIAKAVAKLGELRAYIDSEIDKKIQDAQQALLQCQDCVNIKIDSIIKDAGEVHYEIQGKVDEAISAAIAAAIEYIPHIFSECPSSGVGSYLGSATIPPSESTTIPYQINETAPKVIERIVEKQTVSQPVTIDLNIVVNEVIKALKDQGISTKPQEQIAPIQPDLGPFGNVLFNVQGDDERKRLVSYYGPGFQVILDADDLTALHAATFSRQAETEIPLELLEK